MELKKALMHLNGSGGHSIAQFRGHIIHKHQHQFKALKKKEVLSNLRVQNMDLFQTLVHSNEEAI